MGRPAIWTEWLDDGRGAVRRALLRMPALPALEDALHGLAFRLAALADAKPALDGPLLRLEAQTGPNKAPRRAVLPLPAHTGSGTDSTCSPPVAFRSFANAHDRGWVKIAPQRIAWRAPRRALRRLPDRDVQSGRWRSTSITPPRRRSGRRSSRRCCRTSPTSSATPRRPMPRAGAPGPRSTRRTSGWPPGSTPQAARDRLHLGRHGGEQPCPQGGGLGRQGARPPDRDELDRAPRRQPQPALPREVRVRDRRAAGRPLRPGRPRRGRRRADRPDDPGQHHARQQRGRHHPADRRDRRAGPGPARGALPRRRGPGRALDRPRPRGARRRPGQPGRPQVRGPEGDRRALRPPRHPPPRPAARWLAGTPPAGGHGEPGAGRGDGDRLRARRAPSGPRPSPGCASCATGSETPSWRSTGPS